MEEYIEMFVSESREHLIILNQALLELEKNPDNMEIINEIFRSAHTIKGMSATMGYNDIAELAHKMESAFDQVRNGELKASSDMIDILFSGLDMMENKVDSISEGETEDLDTSELINKLNGIIESKKGKDTKEKPKKGKGKKEKEKKGEKEKKKDLEISPEEMDIINSLDESLSAFKIDVNIDKESMLKSIRAFMVLKNLGEIGEIFKCIPDAQDIEDDKFDFEFSAFLITEKSHGDIEAATNSVSEISGITIEAIKTGTGGKPERTPVEEKIEEAEEPEEKPDAEAEEIETEIEAEEQLEEAEEEPAPIEEPAKPAVEAPKKKTTEIKSVQSVRVSIDKLDVLINLVGELVISKSRLFQIRAKHGIEELSDTLSHIDRLTTDLQDEVTQMRMVEVSYVFDRFPRMIRDLAKKQGKKIDLQIEGKEIELDRTVLDEIGDPLVHLLRNAVDHGIESPEDRKNAGKPENGTIKLFARREKNHVEIVVEDDGKGIDPVKMRQIAVKKGIRTEEEVSKMDDYEAQLLIFAPGFSSAEKITDVSGRGVGMDVVKSKITSLGGTFDLKSVIGEGSRVTLQLPLTLAIIQALLVKAADETYAIPLNNVKETVRIQKDDIKSVKGQEVIRLREKVIPFLRLEKILETNYEMNGEGEHPVVIVEFHGNLVGIQVTDLIGQQEVVIKSLDEILKKVNGFAGATILGDGRVALILDIGSLILGGV